MLYQWTNEVVILTAFPLHYALSNSPNLQLTMTRNFLHCVFPGPLFGQLLVLGLVRFVQSENEHQIDTGILKWYTKIPGNFWNKRVVRVGVAEQRADGEQHFWDGQCWRPLRPGVMWCQYNDTRCQCHSPEDVETDWSVRVDVGMINLSGEGDLWWLKGVIWNKSVKS